MCSLSLRLRSPQHGPPKHDDAAVVVVAAAAACNVENCEWNDGGGLTSFVWNAVLVLRLATVTGLQRHSYSSSPLSLPFAPPAHEPQSQSQSLSLLPSLLTSQLQWLSCSLSLCWQDRVALVGPMLFVCMYIHMYKLTYIQLHIQIYIHIHIYMCAALTLFVNSDVDVNYSVYVCACICIWVCICRVLDRSDAHLSPIHESQSESICALRDLRLFPPPLLPLFRLYCD